MTLEAVAVAHRWRTRHHRHHTAAAARSRVSAVGSWKVRGMTPMTAWSSPSIESFRPSPGGIRELSLPESFAQHDQRLAAFELLAREVRPMSGGAAEELEELGTDESFLRALRRVGAGKHDPADARPSIEGHPANVGSAAANRGSWRPTCRPTGSAA